MNDLAGPPPCIWRREAAFSSNLVLPCSVESERSKLLNYENYFLGCDCEQLETQHSLCVPNPDVIFCIPGPQTLQPQHWGGNAGGEWVHIRKTMGPVHGCEYPDWDALLQLKNNSVCGTFLRWRKWVADLTRQELPLRLEPRVAKAFSSIYIGITASVRQWEATCGVHHHPF